MFLVKYIIHFAILFLQFNLTIIVQSFYNETNNKPSASHVKMLIVFTTFDIPGRVCFVIVKPT